LIKGDFVLKTQKNYINERKTGIHFKEEINHLMEIDLSWPKEKIERHIRATYMRGFEPPYVVIDDLKVNLVRNEFHINERKQGIHSKEEINHLMEIDLSWSKEKIERHIRATSMRGFEGPYVLIDDLKVNLVRNEFHHSSIIESDTIGIGTNIYAFTHIMQGSIIGKNCSIGEHCFIEDGVKIGNNVVIKNGCQIWKGVTIEDNVFFGPGVIITNDKFPRSTRMKIISPRHELKTWLKPTIIKKGSSLGAGVIVVAGVTISRYAAVGAGSVVTVNVDSHTLIVGNPAIKIGWVCKCGMKLLFLNDCAKCSDCLQEYKIDEGKLFNIK